MMIGIQSNGQALSAMCVVFGRMGMLPLNRTIKCLSIRHKVLKFNMVLVSPISNIRDREKCNNTTPNNIGDETTL
jgi:hypothetical protein